MGPINLYLEMFLKLVYYAKRFFQLLKSQLVLISAWLHLLIGLLHGRNAAGLLLASTFFTNFTKHSTCPQMSSKIRIQA